ncbi:DUF6510 family protein [Streptomyces sp. HUAS 31]|uniref:DUF6510 family protein n=1 Tax=Streptomyces sp. HUAS 31 TaxID=3020055 RepID=UPI002FE0622A
MTSVEASGPGTDEVLTGYVDGNALAGPLSEVFAVDVTPATSRCANCGCKGPRRSPARVRARTGPCLALSAVRESGAARDTYEGT